MKLDFGVVYIYIYRRESKMMTRKSSGKNGKEVDKAKNKEKLGKLAM